MYMYNIQAFKAINVLEFEPVDLVKFHAPYNLHRIILYIITI